MKEKTKTDFENWIKKQVKIYKPVLGLELQEIEIKQGKHTDYLSMDCCYPYLEPLIRYSDSAFEAWKKGNLPADRILHELCHILTDPLYVKALSRHAGKADIEDERERLTDTISIIIRNLL